MEEWTCYMFTITLSNSVSGIQ